MKQDSRSALIALASGKVFRGRSFGAIRGMNNPVVGELVFNTSLYGYQEILTDPSYAGQIITFTCPHIGNVGCNANDDESSKLHAEGMVCRTVCETPSNFRATLSLEQYLERAGTMGVSGVDTRDLVTHLRENGAEMAVMASGADIDAEALVSRARAERGMLGRDYVHQVSTKKAYSWSEGTWQLSTDSFRSVPEEKIVTRPHVVALDCGIKRNILRLLVDAGFRVTVVPADTSAEQIQSYRPDGIFLSNGPGDPATLKGIVTTVQKLLGAVPMFGICLGHQILAQAVGGTTYKLKFGHRGGNHPVLNLRTKAVEITVQNHGFAVRQEGLPSDVEISHLNLNDGTVEGLSIPGKRAFSVQYHPEASPGPRDSGYLFRNFYQLVVGGNGEV